MSGPLEGTRVVELAIAIQGPAAGLYFANMGADVIKVEPPYGDASRYHRGANNSMPEDALGTQFTAMNKGKRSMSVDLASSTSDEERMICTTSSMLSRAISKPSTM